MARKKKQPSNNNSDDANKKSDASHKDENLNSQDNKSSFSEVDKNGRYPNELARMSFSAKNKSITNVDVVKKDGQNIDVPKDVLVNSNFVNDDKFVSDATKKCDIKISPGTEKIWKNLALGKINLYYAQVGVTFDDRPVIDHDLLVTTLVTYGFTVDNALDFIEDFVENTKDDMLGPIIMINSHMRDITQSIEPLE